MSASRKWLFCPHSITEGWGYQRLLNLRIYIGSEQLRCCNQRFCPMASGKLPQMGHARWAWPISHIKQTHPACSESSHSLGHSVLLQAVGTPGGTVVKNPPASAGGVRDSGSVFGSGRSPRVGNGNPLQYSSVGNPADRQEPVAYSRWGCKELDMSEHTHVAQEPVEDSQTLQMSQGYLHLGKEVVCDTKSITSMYT